ncbi:MAG: TldD/PmbA family protein, partial [Acidobacteriia bacterium]|nr:TldD/PmbA family protein [Terriglobia bacterium]
MITRRVFLATPSLLAADLFGAEKDTRKIPTPQLEKLAAAALREAAKHKASYCDIRINRYRDQNLSMRLTPERGTGKTMEVPAVSDRESFGFGVRVIVDGAWGFASSPNVTQEEIARITAEAVTVARANAMVKDKPVILAPTKSFRDRWVSRFEKNPFDAPIEEKLTLLREAAAEAKKGKHVFTAMAGLNFHSEDKYFASSEGSSIQQFIVQTFPALLANAVDISKGLSRNRSYMPAPLLTGYEYVPKINLKENAQRIREEVAEHLAAPAVTPGKKDLVLLPSHLFLTIHESIGHSTELDRALGYEANFAGTSFLTTNKMGKERVGSDAVTIYGDRTMPEGLAT